MPQSGRPETLSKKGNAFSLKGKGTISPKTGTYEPTHTNCHSIEQNAQFFGPTLCLPLYNIPHSILGRLQTRSDVAPQRAVQLLAAVNWDIMRLADMQIGKLSLDPVRFDFVPNKYSGPPSRAV